MVAEENSSINKPQYLKSHPNNAINTKIQNDDDELSKPLMGVNNQNLADEDLLNNEELD